MDKEDNVGLNLIGHEEDETHDSNSNRNEEETHVLNLNRDEANYSEVNIDRNEGGPLPEDIPIPKPEELGSTLKEITRNLEVLRDKYAEKKLKTVIPKKIIENKKVADFLKKAFNETSENSMRTRQRKKRLNLLKENDEIKKLLEENSELSQTALRIYKENTRQEFVIIGGKAKLKGGVEERNKLWKEASKLLTVTTMKFSESDQSSSSEMDDDSSEYDKGKMIKRGAQDVLNKLDSIKQIARILNNIITYSEEPWATDEKLLEVICCTGKLLEKDFYKENFKELEDLVSDLSRRLDRVKL